MSEGSSEGAVPAREATIWRTLLLALAAGGALWIVVAAQAGSYSPDSYAYALLGRSLWAGEGYASPAIRDFHGIRALPQPSRSFPPLWPVVVGGLDRLTGLGMTASLVAAFLGLALLSAAVGALAWRLEPRRAWLVWLALPAALLLDSELQAELAAGRAIPIAMALQVAALAAAISLLEDAAARWKAALVGALLCASVLARFDEGLSAAGVLLAAAWWWRRALGSGRAAPLVLLAGGAAALLYAPWAIRNLLVFGTPLASDNAATIASTWPDIVPICWFAPGLEPPTFATAPGTWLQQRLGYLLASLARASAGSMLAFPLAFALAAWRWRSMSTKGRAFVALALVAAVTRIAAVSLTPYTDLRYFSGVNLLSLLVAALVLAELAAGKPIVVWIGRIAMLGVIVGIGFRAAPLLTSAGGSVTRESARAARFAAVGAAMQDLPVGLVASVQADELAWYTGWPAIYFPKNARERVNFRDWLREFRPRYAVASWRELRSLGLEGAVRSRTPQGDVILELAGESFR